MLISGTSLSTPQTRCGAGLHGNKINMGMNLEKWTSDIQSIVGCSLTRQHQTHSQSLVCYRPSQHQTHSQGPVPEHGNTRHSQSWACSWTRQHQTQSIMGLYLNKATPHTVNRGPVPEQGNTMYTVSHLAVPDTQSITGLLLNKATPETQTIIQFTLMIFVAVWRIMEKCTWNCLFPFLR